MDAITLDKNGKVIKKAMLVGLFDGQVNQEAMILAVNVYLANQRQAIANVKTRGEVEGSTRKIYKQKGTGNSRQGGKRSPLHRGGGKMFGPSSDVNYKKTLPKKVKKLAIRSALNQKAIENHLFIVSDIEMPKEKLSKAAYKFIKTSKIDGSLQIIIEKPDDILRKAFESLDDIKVNVINELNVYNLLKYTNLLMIGKSLEIAEKYWNNAK